MYKVHLQTSKVEQQQKEIVSQCTRRKTQRSVALDNVFKIRSHFLGGNQSSHHPLRHVKQYEISIWCSILYTLCEDNFKNELRR